MNNIDLISVVYKAIEDKKGEDIKVIDISDVSSMTDYFIIADASNLNQLQAISEEIQDKLSAEGVEPKQIEGQSKSSWILLDYSDVIIHLFLKEDRLFYDLERIWSDGKIVDIG